MLEEVRPLFEAMERALTKIYPDGQWPPELDQALYLSSTSPNEIEPGTPWNEYSWVDRSGAEAPTMAKEYINPESLFRSVDHGFSQAVAASGRRTLYVSGQTAWDSSKQLVGGLDLAAQARQAFRNLRTVVEASGGTLADVVSLRLYIVDYRPEKAEAVGRALSESFAGPAKPAATWIGVASLADPGFLIEIEATAVLE